jgi:hypothetical protein
MLKNSGLDEKLYVCSVITKKLVRISFADDMKIRLANDLESVSIIE